VTVTWDVFLETLDGKLLAGPIRKRQLRKEVSASLLGLGPGGAHRADRVQIPMGIRQVCQERAGSLAARSLAHASGKCER